ncbi:hypothetical protein H1O25_002704 [Escherichia coli]|uniref:hypothetical protein n=1 Tax=Escherichia coli TaxID=562 RepID=UPI0038D45652|nr:hypothetical protein [Escherichia coli]EKJ3326862.1 hypothetical protein [Escherichia coli]
MKPSYEELEEQLNRSRRLCDAALANERAWEKAHGIRLYVAANQLFDFAIERGVITFNN